VTSDDAAIKTLPRHCEEHSDAAICSRDCFSRYKNRDRDDKGHAQRDKGGARDDKGHAQRDKGGARDDNPYPLVLK